MTPHSVAAVDAARRLWARAGGETSAPEEAARAAERMCFQLRTGLGRWIGVGGYRALLDRALGLVRTEHPALDGLWCHAHDDPVTRAAAPAYDAAEIAAGMVALVTTLLELLGRIIGEEMAVRLVEQIGRPRRRRFLNTEVEGGRDG